MTRVLEAVWAAPVDLGQLARSVKAFGLFYTLADVGLRGLRALRVPCEPGRAVKDVV